ncbi:MAG: HesA/MoeB/ThiF family protein [Chloroflexi bacterium]|nr:HesA/MoeB/ThiF family protein [Chloroflexota bacterium]
MGTDKPLGEEIERLSIASGDLRVLPVEAIRNIARRLGVPERQVELTALGKHILPVRYQRNLGTVGWDGQAKLLQSSVAVIGAGGLGGYIVEGLARMGVGGLLVVDSDVFEAHNLNRQLLSTERDLGRSKVECAQERVSCINSAVSVTSVRARAGRDNLPGLLEGYDVAVDALDSLPARFELQEAAQARGIPMVHGAIAGYLVQVMTILPGDRGLKSVYGEGDVPEKGIESWLGNPAGTPMLCAACQVQEVVKLITGHGELLRNRMLMIDSEVWEIQMITWDRSSRRREWA